MVGRIDLSRVRELPQLDVKDKRILSLLATDARQPLTQVAKQVRLSRDAVEYRIRRMQEQEIILGFVPQLDFGRLGFYTFHVFLLIDDMAQKQQDALIAFLAAHKNVRSVIEYSDRWDLEVVLLARSLQDFDDLVLDIAQRYPDIILEKDKVEIIKQYGHTAFPRLLPDEKRVRSSERPPVDKIELDATDLRILAELGKDCRASTYVIGSAVGMSADAVAYRIKRLVSSGVIRRFTIAADLTLLGLQWYTYTIETKMFTPENEATLEEFLDMDPSVIRSAKTLGGWDLLLYVVAASPHDFHVTVRALKGLFPSIVKNYQAWIAYKEHAHTPVPACLLGETHNKPAAKKRKT